MTSETDSPAASALAVPTLLSSAAEDEAAAGGLATADIPGGLSAEDEAALTAAVRALEGSGFAAQLTAIVGRQLGFAGDLIPARVAETANKAAGTALRYALRGAVKSLPADVRPARDRLHLAAVAATGAVGGAFGLATLPLELPLSTTLILRSVAEIAREQGEDLALPDTLLSCLEVFALGSGRDVAMGESSYFAVRTLLAKSVSEAARYIVGRSVTEEAAPVMARLMGQIASRFGLVVTQKFVAQAIPVIGAVTGASINAAFMDHYQNLARGHFTVRRLERIYGAALVRDAYDRIRTQRPPVDPNRHSAVATLADVPAVTRPPEIAR